MKSLNNIILGLTAKQRIEVFGLLTLTYPRYIDSASRNVVENSLRELISFDLSESITLTNAINWLSEVVGGGPVK